MNFRFILNNVNEKFEDLWKIRIFDFDLFEMMVEFIELTDR
jgi:hypothetical protein